MTERYWARPNWIRWLNVPSVPLDVAASLSLGFEPQSTQEITWDENGGKTVKWFHPAHTTNEGSDRLSRLRDFFNTEHLPAYEVPALPGHRPEERIRLLDLVRFAVAQDWDIPPKLTKLLPVEPSTPSVVQAAALPSTAPVVMAGASAGVERVRAKRRTWRDVAWPYMQEVFKSGQYATAKDFYRALEKKAGADSPFDIGTGPNLGSIFVRDISEKLTFKTIQNTVWPNLTKG